MKFSERLKKARAKAKLNQAKMADLIGMSYSMYSKYESGAFSGDDSKIEKYLDKLESIENGKLLSNQDEDFNPAESVQFLSMANKNYLDMIAVLQSALKDLREAYKDVSDSNKTFNKLLNLEIDQGSFLTKKSTKTEKNLHT